VVIQAIGGVFVYRLVREERVVLKDHPHSFTPQSEQVILFYRRGLPAVDKNPAFIIHIN
jgi:hypothetical protein